MDYPKQIKELIESFQSLPGVGKKTAERLALYCFSDLELESAKRLAESIINVKESLHRCPVCGSLSETESECEICQDQTRNRSILMVVENVKDVFIMERTKTFNGLYHVLNGAINLASGIGVEELNIGSLIERVKEGQIKEVILATNATTEGETTARYIKILLENENVSVTRIAHGLPFGGDISYVDELTLIKALEGRTNY